MVVADLHVHTTNSDGTLTLSTLPDAAKRAGVDVVAVTDHDRTHPELSTPVAHLDGVTVVSGIELRVETDAERVDLLGYGVERTDDLDALVESLQTDRIERGRRIIDAIEERLGVELPVEPREGLGRPHIARAVAEVTDYEYGEVFEELIGDDGPCYVARDIPSFERGRSVLEDACGVVGLAHPYRYDDPEAAIELCSELDAVERFYPYGREVDPRPLDRAIGTYDLLSTGGSDAHEETLGKAGLDREDYRRFRAAL
ncbi:PHP domain-containing protein [Natronomonas gomsonensis]|jgi:predicted metal-dependent phosphoesterase TrpH|uniref:PHP domain-containing protein n=1 Tax=Natronomonas gomsonensis TaxID=1046043 RepID=UPI0020CA9107|nr:PHP domain-containing protein [Natronomonas gomsonensis]MCY4729484.1 PHP domain-containing protein [Natronomonas gomsonensis]